MLDKTTEKTGRVLKDGKHIGELVNRSRRAIDLRVASDPEIFELEKELLWAKAWIVVGHESEIPNAGDYVTRDVGEDRVVLIRDKDGSIHGLLNVCPHKGMQVVRTDAGNAPILRCVLHGWTFDRDGSFRGAPFKTEVYGDSLKPCEQGLIKARIGTVAGIIFLCWDEEAPSLDTYLGDMKGYLEIIFGRGPDGCEVLGPPQRWVVNANWKVMAEMFAGDNYHSATLHRAIAEMGAVQGDPNNPDYWGLNNMKISFDEGHALITHDLHAMYESIAKMRGEEDMTLLEKFTNHPPAGLPREMAHTLLEKFSDDELKMLSDRPPSVGGLFPNVALISFLVPLPDGTLSSSYGMHTFVPMGPDKTAYIHWNFVAKGADEAYRRISLMSSTFNLGACGFVEQDDNQIYDSIQRSAKGFIGRRSQWQYPAIAGDTVDPEWPGGGHLHFACAHEDGHWRWWQRYFAFMTEQA